MSNTMSSGGFGLSVHEFIEKALEEDVGNGDHTSLATIPPEATGKGIVKVKEPGIVAGLALAARILNHVDPGVDVKVLKKDGDAAVSGEELMHAAGNTRSLLKAERLLLNCMQRMSGIATKTRALVKLTEGTRARLLDTRKTTPNFRMFEKQAVEIGGGVNHRFGLYDMILIKDNHVDASGGVENAIDGANAYLLNKGMKLRIEIETRDLAEVERVLRHGKVHRIMLDNFSIENLKRAVDLVQKRFETEASGGITEDTIRPIAETGVDFISVGALTHSYRSLDISMKIIRK